MATSLGAFGPLFGSDYVYNATALADALTSLGVTFPNNQLQRGEQRLTLVRHNSLTSSWTLADSPEDDIIVQYIQLDDCMCPQHFSSQRFSYSQ